MASTFEILGGGIAFVSFTIVDIMFYFMGNALLKPLIELIDKTPISPLLNFGDMTYIIYAVWAFLLIFEIVAILAFVAILARRQTNVAEYGY